MSDALLPPRRSASSGVRVDGSGAAWIAIARAREAHAAAASDPGRAATLWSEAASAMERAARGTSDPRFRGSYLRAAASLALHAGETTRAAALDAAARLAATEDTPAAPRARS